MPDLSGWPVRIAVMGHGGMGFTDGPDWIDTNFSYEKLQEKLRRAANQPRLNGYIVFEETGGPIGYRSTESWIRHNVAPRFRILSQEAKPFRLAPGLWYMSFTALGLALFVGVSQMMGGAPAMMKGAQESTAA